MQNFFNIRRVWVRPTIPSRFGEIILSFETTNPKHSVLLEILKIFIPVIGKNLNFYKLLGIPALTYPNSYFGYRIIIINVFEFFL